MISNTHIIIFAHNKNNTRSKYLQWRCHPRRPICSIKSQKNLVTLIFTEEDTNHPLYKDKQDRLTDNWVSTSLFGGSTHEFPKSSRKLLIFFACPEIPYIQILISYGLRLISQSVRRQAKEGLWNVHPNSLSHNITQVNESKDRWMANMWTDNKRNKLDHNRMMLKMNEWVMVSNKSQLNIG